MSFIVVGLNHRSAPLEIRERLAFSREEIGGVSGALKTLESIEEGVILSTCNRTELLVAPRNGMQPEAAVRLVRDFLCSQRGMDPGQLEPCLYSHHGLEAVRHVFRVASSLDSMVVGEPQILGQVKEAYNLAVQSELIGPRLDGLLQRAFSVAKRVRARTQIARNPVSISYAAVDLATRIFGSLQGRSVMILGAGKMADLAAKHLIAGGVRQVYVASRSLSHAQEVAARFHGIPLTLDRFREQLPEVDIVISSTAAPHYILRGEDGPPLMKARRGRPIFFIDIAVPRDIDPGLNKLDNLYLYDIDDLQRVVDAGMEERLHEAQIAEALIEEEVTQYHTRSQAREATPSIVQLREQLHGVAESELKRFRGKLGPLSEQQETVVKEMLASLVNKMLHGPTREMKQAGGRPGGGDTIELVRRMFGLTGQEGSGSRRKGSSG